MPKFKMTGVSLRCNSANLRIRSLNETALAPATSNKIQFIIFWIKNKLQYVSKIMQSGLLLFSFKQVISFYFIDLEHIRTYKSVFFDRF